MDTSYQVLDAVSHSLIGVGMIALFLKSIALIKSKCCRTSECIIKLQKKVIPSNIGENV